MHEELCERGLAQPEAPEDDDDDHFPNTSSQSLDDNESGGTGVDKDALRLYELSKLKYYFAIVECDTVQTASSLYERMDGIEFEHSSMALDLRFVPDDIR